MAFNEDESDIRNFYGVTQTFLRNTARTARTRGQSTGITPVREISTIIARSSGGGKDKSVVIHSIKRRNGDEGRKKENLGYKYKNKNRYGLRYLELNVPTLLYS